LEALDDPLRLELSDADVEEERLPDMDNEGVVE
jgi:hypothetical protein